VAEARDQGAAQPRYFEAVIKIDRADPPERRAIAIEEGIGYAVSLLMDEYDRAADEIASLLERVTDEAYDQEARFTGNA
jgi:hypothetical protein